MDSMRATITGSGGGNLPTGRVLGRELFHFNWFKCQFLLFPELVLTDGQNSCACALETPFLRILNDIVLDSFSRLMVIRWWICFEGASSRLTWFDRSDNIIFSLITEWHALMTLCQNGLPFSISSERNCVATM
jgi:hypothetical protein